MIYSEPLLRRGLVQDLLVSLRRMRKTEELEEDMERQRKGKEGEGW